MAAAHRSRQPRSAVLLLLPAVTRTTQVQAVLQELETLLQLGAPTPEDIHRMRVCIKKLRGWLRLLRFVDGRGTGRKADKDLRAIAAGFSAQRDRQVLEQTLTLLQQHCPDAASVALLATLRQTLVSQPAAITPMTLADAARQGLRRLCSRQVDSKDLVKGLETSYRRARRLGEGACTADATDALRHRWRKRVKYLGYQLQLVCAPRLGKRTPLQTALSRLGATLGILQDLYMLERRLAELAPAGADPEALALAGRLLARERKRLLTSIARLRRSCFSGKGLAGLSRL